jgi:hypothetical protein
MLTQQEKIWWSINIQSFEEKCIFSCTPGATQVGLPSRNIASSASEKDKSLLVQKQKVQNQKPASPD